MVKKIIIYLMLCPLATYAGNAKLISMKMELNNSAVHIIFVRNQTGTQHVFALSRPNRLVVDFPHTRLVTALNNTPLTSSLVKKIRYGHPVPDTLRIVFDIDEAGRFKILSPPYNKKLMIAVYFAHPVRGALPTVVVIDPGHGGKDPGAVGALGTTEKNITLAIAKKLADLLNHEKNMHAFLTRKGDYFVPLRNRLQLARKENARIFIAVHADSYFNTHANGASVYALSQHGATSEAARWLAKRDNYSELGGVDLSDLTDQSYLLRSVLIDLAQTATITDSLRLGTLTLSKLKPVTTLHYTRVEQAPFMVLKSPDIPSILVETGFLSNTQEERRLCNKNYQAKIAKAMHDSITLYLKKNV